MDSAARGFQTREVWWTCCESPELGVWCVNMQGKLSESLVISSVTGQAGRHRRVDSLHGDVRDGLCNCIDSHAIVMSKILLKVVTVILKRPLPTLRD